MYFKIKSRKLQRVITFSRPGNFYIFADINGQAGALGTQICSKGAIGGATLEYEGHDQAEFVQICHRWYRSYTAKNGQAD